MNYISASLASSIDDANVRLFRTFSLSGVTATYCDGEQLCTG